MNKKSIFYLFVIVIITGISINSINAKANNPPSMSLSYNSSTKVLGVTITHNTDNDPNHYIQSVRINVNASTVKTETYTSQPNSGTFTYQYDNITANSGATIEARAECSIAESITRSIVVGEDPGEQDGEPQIIGFIGIILIMVFFSTILLLIFNKEPKKVIK